MLRTLRIGEHLPITHVLVSALDTCRFCLAYTGSITTAAVGHRLIAACPQTGKYCDHNDPTLDSVHG